METDRETQSGCIENFVTENFPRNGGKLESVRRAFEHRNRRATAAGSSTKHEKGN